MARDRFWDDASFLALAPATLPTFVGNDIKGDEQVDDDDDDANKEEVVG